MTWPDPRLNNTPHHILFIISDAGRAAITVWSLILTALSTGPCVSHSCLLPVHDIYSIARPGFSLNRLVWEGVITNLTQMNLNAESSRTFANTDTDVSGDYTVSWSVRLSVCQWAEGQSVFLSIENSGSENNFCHSVCYISTLYLLPGMMPFSWSLTTCHAIVEIIVFPFPLSA